MFSSHFSDNENWVSKGRGKPDTKRMSNKSKYEEIEETHRNPNLVQNTQNMLRYMGASRFGEKKHVFPQPCQEALAIYQELGLKSFQLQGLEALAAACKARKSKEASQVVWPVKKHRPSKWRPPT